MSVKLVVVGSIGIDTIETPSDRREDILGGSVSYACAAASYFAPVGMVGVVGDDFPVEYRKLYESFGIELSGLQQVEGKTFKWSGVYEENMNNRTTLSTELNVFESFSPALPESYQNAEYILLGNITPALQLDVLSQAKGAKFVAADTMDLWINIARDELVEVISKVDMLTLNDSEAELFTGEKDPVKAAKKIRAMGPEYVVVKKGAHGALLVSAESHVDIPAYKVDMVVDPTGAGDSFAGGLMGYLARENDVTDDSISKAMLYGSVVASFGVEDFSLDRISTLAFKDIEDRFEELCGALSE